MTVDDLLRKILVILPDAEIDEGDDGELIISTGLCEGEDGIEKQLAAKESA